MWLGPRFSTSSSCFHTVCTSSSLFPQHVCGWRERSWRFACPGGGCAFQAPMLSSVGRSKHLPTHVVESPAGSSDRHHNILLYCRTRSVSLNRIFYEAQLRVSGLGRHGLSAAAAAVATARGHWWPRVGGVWPKYPPHPRGRFPPIRRWWARVGSGGLDQWARVGSGRFGSSPLVGSWARVGST